MIRLVWDPKKPSDVFDAGIAFHLYRGQRLVARSKKKGKKVSKFTGKSGELHFVQPPTSFERILNEDED